MKKVLVVSFGRHDGVNIICFLFNDNINIQIREVFSAVSDKSEESQIQYSITHWKSCIIQRVETMAVQTFA
jgi:hypothetical protein